MDTEKPAEIPVPETEAETEKPQKGIKVKSSGIGSIIAAVMSLFNPNSANTPANYNPELGTPPTPIERQVQEGIDNPAGALANREASDKTAAQQHQVDITETQKAIDAQMRANKAFETEQQTKANQKIDEFHKTVTENQKKTGYTGEPTPTATSTPTPSEE